MGALPNWSAVLLHLAENVVLEKAGESHKNTLQGKYYNYWNRLCGRQSKKSQTMPTTKIEICTVLAFFITKCSALLHTLFFSKSCFLVIGRLIWIISLDQNRCTISMSCKYYCSDIARSEHSRLSCFYATCSTYRNMCSRIPRTVRTGPGGMFLSWFGLCVEAVDYETNWWENICL